MSSNLIRRFSKKFFIITNILTAVLYVLGCYGNVFFTPALWPVGFLSLAAFYLLLVLIGFIIFWLFAKRGWALVSTIAILVTLGPIRHMVPFHFSHSFDEVAKVDDTRIMSWNVAQFDILYYKKRPDIREDMIALVNQYKPDIACFQEMVAGDTLVNLNTYYYRKYSFFSVFEYMSRLQFPYYSFSYNYKDDFLERQHFGLITFSRYPIINKQVIRIDPNDYNSTFQYVDIVKEKDTLRVFNIHMQSLKFSDKNKDYLDHPSLESKQDLKRSKNILAKLRNGFLRRYQQVNRVKEEIDKSPYPVIVCGDFNDVPNSYAYRTVGEKLQNAFTEKGFGLGRTFNGIAPTLRIDNIFVDPSFSVHQFLRIPVDLSDHYPIITDIGHQTTN